MNENGQVKDEKNLCNMLLFHFLAGIQMRFRVESEGRKKKKEHLEVKFGMKHSSLDTMDYICGRH